MNTVMDGVKGFTMASVATFLPILLHYDPTDGKAVAIYLVTQDTSQGQTSNYVSLQDNRDIKSFFSESFKYK